ncbi:hypothetical protein AB0M05_35765 [Streptomyces violaceusniger]|uniref:hypothetical protein n=1 Tax=Streptomyces TaxID=1883 RepID=UPI003440E772
MTELAPSDIQPEEPFDHGRKPRAEQQAVVERHSSERRTPRLRERFLEGMASGVGETVGRILVGLVVLGVVAIVALF